MKKRVYFPGLDALRFWAAIVVVIGHIDQFKSFFRVDDKYHHGIFQISLPFLDEPLGGLSAWDAVTLFFVLSGFLITYLLLAELGETNTINVRKFYIRRILRIWPLYYLIIGIGFFVVPGIVRLTGYDGYYIPMGDDFFLKLFLFVFFLPNVTITPMITLSPVALTHLWSIGVEEQFYLLWPRLLRAFRRYVLPCLLGIIVIKLLFNAYAGYYWATNPPINGYEGWDFVVLFLIGFRIESMAIGGVGAYLIYHNKERILSIIFHPVVEKLIFFGIVAHLFVLRVFHPWGDYAVSVLYILFILNLSCNPKSTVKLDHHIYREIGKFSYGIYMYHLTTIYLTLMFFDIIGFNDNGLIYNIALFSVVIASTVGLSALTYYIYELPFLRLKKRFTIIESGAQIESTDAPPSYTHVLSDSPTNH